MSADARTQNIPDTERFNEMVLKLDGVFVVGATHGTPGTETTHAHTLGRVPRGFIVFSRDKAGHVYDSSAAHTDTLLKVKGDVATTAFKAYVF